jgi:hypothetical protein
MAFEFSRSNGIVLLVSVVIAVLCIIVVDDNWRRACIKRGVAGYNPQTGNWQWTIPAAQQVDNIEEKPAKEVNSVVVEPPQKNLLLPGEKK